MELEEILKKYIEAKKLLEDNELLVATGLVDLGESKNSKSADALLAKATKADAEVLAKATETAADQLRISNEKSVRWMTWLTVAMLTVGLIQIIIAIISFFK